eukprot:1243182-Amphidinium_carterae.3
MCGRGSACWAKPGRPMRSLALRVQALLSLFLFPSDGKQVAPVTLDLSSWMGQLEPVITGATLLDLTLPGAHDAMTYDLSDSLSDGYEGMGPALSAILHAVTPAMAGRFIRQQGQTQGLSVESMLDGGVRFIDFRIMYSSAPDRVAGDKDWYCLHGCQSKQKAIAYLQTIQSWLQKHPKEIVVIMATRHGSVDKVGVDQYPNTKPEERQNFFAQ